MTYRERIERRILEREPSVSNTLLTTVLYIMVCPMFWHPGNMDG